MQSITSHAAGQSLALIKTAAPAPPLSPAVERVIADAVKMRSSGADSITTFLIAKAAFRTIGLDRASFAAAVAELIDRLIKEGRRR